ncbi:MAG: ATP-binding cassette domain-containing protein [Bacteroidaceae bacterium]|nr:ATP-binding cassette domain-containing protein [Bacteroidaceae bacterium]
MDPVLRIEHVSKTYTGHKALDDVSMEVPRGSIYGLLGPNGAGKTTLIRVVNHMTIPDCGKVWFEDHEITAEDIYQIGYMPEERGLYKKMKVGEQAVFFARMHGMSRAAATRKLRQWFDRLGLEGWWDKKVEDLSKGMAQKVQFITTVVHEPKLLIFDEPFSGFDPINQNLLKEEILGLRDRGATVIFSTHNMESVEEICDDITLINKSHNILSGPVDEIRRKAGGNTFQVVYSGESDKFNSCVEGKATLIGEPEGLIGGYTQQKIHIADDSDVRPVIGTLNDNVNLRSFQEIIPSMNDIFIRAVNGTL